MFIALCSAPGGDVFFPRRCNLEAACNQNSTSVAQKTPFFGAVEKSAWHLAARFEPVIHSSAQTLKL
jgi:hypothetical protein